LRIALIDTAKALSGLGLFALLLAAPGCAVRKVTRVHPPGQPIPALNANLADLVAKINAWSEGIHTMTATVDLEPTAGSVYSGVIKEYHDVKGFVLLQTPSHLRMQGQAPVVRTTIFDMVSNGEEFRLYLPTKQKFIIGKTSYQHPAKNALENLRPQHILQALLVPPVDAERETTFVENFDSSAEAKRYYIVTVVEALKDKHIILRRKLWFDRTDLELSRAQFYDSKGDCTEDVQYSGYQDFQGTRYASHIKLDRPEDDYDVTLTVEKANFNQPIAAEKFELKKPETAELVDLSAAKQGETPVGK
jgi:outer membrane lipoprotein-sorting protein